MVAVSLTLFCVQVTGRDLLRVDDNLSCLGAGATPRQLNFQNNVVPRNYSERTIPTLLKGCYNAEGGNRTHNPKGTRV